MDGWAGVAAARVDSWSDLVQVLTQPLTAGVAGDNANFWRPGFQLYQAGQRALFGLDAGLWHLCDLAVHIGVVAMLGWTAKRLGLGDWGALLAAGILALHPLGVEVIPATDRGADLLVTGAALLTIVLALGKQPALSALGLLLALTFKELAAVLLPLCVALVWDQRGRRAAAGVALSQAGVLGAWLLLRGRVLAGLGGYEQGFLVPTGLEEPLRKAGPDLLVPGWTWLLSEAFPSVVAEVVVGALLAGLIVLGAWKLRERAAVQAGFGLLILALLLLGVTALYNRRLLYLPCAGLALLVAGWIREPGALRAGGCVVLALIASTSPLVHRDQDWVIEARLAEQLTVDVVDQVAALPPGTELWLVDRCIRVDSDRTRYAAWGEGSTHTYCIGGYSLQAYYDDQLGPGHVQIRKIAQRFVTEPLGPVQVVPLQDGRVDVIRDTEGLRTMKSAKEVWRMKREPDVLHLTAKQRPAVLLVAGADVLVVQ